jgi:hypothetical protein
MRRYADEKMKKQGISRVSDIINIFLYLPAMGISIKEKLRSKRWRRGRDSNPRSDFSDTRFPGVPVKPLQYLSALR